LTTLADNAERLPETLRDAASLSPMRFRSLREGDAIESYEEFLREEPPASAEEMQAIETAWEHLYARAAREPFGMHDAWDALIDLDGKWRDPSATLLMQLMDQSTSELRALSERTEAPEMGDEARRAADAVQFSVAQIFASSQMPPTFR
jgi:hypothetical protein